MISLKMKNVEGKTRRNPEKMKMQRETKEDTDGRNNHRKVNFSRNCFELVISSEVAEVEREVRARLINILLGAVGNGLK